MALFTPNINILLDKTKQLNSNYIRDNNLNMLFSKAYHLDADFERSVDNIAHDKATNLNAIEKAAQMLSLFIDKELA